MNLYMNDVLLDFCKAWQILDANLIIKHLDDNFVYDSQWVLSSLDCSGYKDYITKKFNILKEKGCCINALIVDDPYFQGGRMLKLIQDNNVCYYRIQISNNKVIKGDLCMF